MIFGRPLLDVLDRIDIGGIILDPAGNAVAVNGKAVQTLKLETTLPQCKEELEWTGRSLKALILRCRTRFTLNAESWFTIARERKRDLVLHIIPVGGNPAHTAVIMVDLDRTPQPSVHVLQRMFGLTAAEARLAIHIASGESPADIAKTNHVTISTIRSQLASVFAKTQTTRQVELVAVLARVAILP